MGDIVTITDEEIGQIKDIQNSYAYISTRLGKMELDKIMLSKHSDLLKSELDKLIELESTMMTNLNTKYGEGVINPETGEFKKQE